MGDYPPRTVRLGPGAEFDRIRAATHFEPKIGPLCRWCEFADICPAQAKRREATCRGAGIDSLPP